MQVISPPIPLTSRCAGLSRAVALAGGAGLVMGAVPIGDIVNVGALSPLCCITASVAGADVVAAAILSPAAPVVLIALFVTASFACMRMLRSILVPITVVALHIFGFIIAVRAGLVVIPVVVRLVTSQAVGRDIGLVAAGALLPVPGIVVLIGQNMSRMLRINETLRAFLPVSRVIVIVTVVVGAVLIHLVFTGDAALEVFAASKGLDVVLAALLCRCVVASGAFLPVLFVLGRV